MCNIWRKKNSNELTTEETGRFFSKNNYFSWVDLSGGEVFLRQDLFDIVKIIISRSPNLYLLHFPTNGFMTDRIVSLTEDILPYFKKKIILTISLDGPALLHDKIRGVDGCWQRSIDTYKKLKKIKGKNLEVYFGVTITDENIYAFRDTYYSAKAEIPNLRYDDLHFNFVHNSKHYYDYQSGSIVGQERYVNALEEIISSRAKSLYPVHLLENDYLQFMRKYLRTATSPLTCEALSSSCFIAPDGDVYACSIWNKKIGNLRDADFDLERILDSHDAKMLRSQIRQGKCSHCWTPCEAYTAIMAHKIPFLKR